MSGDLKPCPWCGGPSALYSDESWPWHTAYCSGPDECSHMGGDNEADLVARWNTRTPDPAVAVLEAEVARLREAVALWLKWSRIRLGDPRDHPAMMAALEASWALENTLPAPSEKEAG